MIPVPPVCVWVSPFRLLGGSVEWRGGVCGDVPCLDGVWHLVLFCSPLALSCPSLCLLSQRCWFRCVSLWQGCVIVEWRGVVYVCVGMAGWCDGVWC